jgi:enoyl-CoA hydratase/carnithine racemase
MADDARLRAPFCPLGVAPEAASSVLFPDRMGWQRAAWVLLSGEWVDAPQALDMGIAWKVVPREAVVATKRAMLVGRADRVRAARQTEDDAFRTLIGSPGNIEAVTAFLERREPDFTGIDGA